MIESLVVILASGLACPGTIKDRQEVIALDSTWAVEMDDKPRRLDHGRVYSGHPSLNRQLKGIGENGGMKWKLNNGEYWIVCSYQKSAVKLIRRIDAPADCMFVPGNSVENVDPAVFSCKSA